MIARCVPRRNGKRSVHFFALAPMMVAALFLLSCADHPPNSDAQQKEDKAAAMAAAKDTATIDDARCQSFGFQPGTTDTEMQVIIRASGVNMISKIPREKLTPVAYPARAIVYLCTPEADDYAGKEFSLNDEEFRRRIGIGT